MNRTITKQTIQIFLINSPNTITLIYEPTTFFFFFFYLVPSFTPFTFHFNRQISDFRFRFFFYLLLVLTLGLYQLLVDHLNIYIGIKRFLQYNKMYSKLQTFCLIFYLSFYIKIALQYIKIAFLSFHNHSILLFE